MIEATYPQIPDAFRLTFGAFDARLVQAYRIARMRLGLPPDGDADAEGLQKIEEGDDALPPYTGFSQD